MRRLVFQFMVPPLTFVSVATAGYALDRAWAGFLAGFALSIVVANVLAVQAARRLRRIELISRGDVAIDLVEESAAGGPDEIDRARRAVAQRAIGDAARRRADRDVLAQQSQLLDRMNDGLMRVAADGRVTFSNVAAGALFGGRNPTGRSLMSVTRDHELNRATKECLESGSDRQHTFEIAGEGRLVNAIVIRIAERPPEALVMLRDITEVNRLQNLRRDFVANVSHELRTPLSTIKILAETLLDLRAEDDEAVDFLRKIDNEVDSMTALVRDLLDLTRLETLGGRLSLREIDTASLVQDVTDRMRPLADRHGVEIVLDLDPEARTLVVDERRLHQALINLITNAIVHTPRAGAVTVGARRVDGGTTFVVRDTGSGIPREALPRIWERFYKTDRARTGPGTGLGLAIVKHIVQAHGGTVSATSELGVGSEFLMTIPDYVGPVARLPAAVDVPIAPY